MKWVILNGERFTFAPYIQQFAEEHGYTPPRDPEGRTHPGTDCNAKMRTIFKNAGLRATFNLSVDCVLDVSVELNNSWVNKLVNRGVLNSAYLKQKNIQLYAPEAVNALLSTMLNNHVEYELEDNDEVWHVVSGVIASPHNLERKRFKPKASLFKKSGE